MTDLEKEVRSFLLASLSGRLDAEEIKRLSQEGDVDLVGSGVISSLDFIGLISSIEEKFGVEIDFERHDPSQYTTLAGLANLVALSGR